MHGIEKKCNTVGKGVGRGGPGSLGGTCGPLSAGSAFPFVQSMDEAHAVFTTIVASLKGCGDKYGDALHDWLSSVVDGQRPKCLPRLDKRRLSAGVRKRRQLAHDAAKAFRDLLRMRWSAGGGKRKVERQAERRSMHRSIRRQLEEPMDAACYYDGPDSSDDEAILCWPVACEEPFDESCSDYELERLRTIVKNARVLVSIFATGHGKDEADKAEKGLRQAEKMLEAEEAIHWSAAQHKIEKARKVERESQLEAAAQYDAWEDACMY